MKFTSEVIKSTGTILAFTCSNISKPPYKLYLLIVLLSILGFLLKQPLIILPIIYAAYSFRTEVTKETLYVIKGLGLQLTKFTRDNSSSNIFIDMSDIKEFIINETLSPYDARINLGIILTKSSHFIIPFQHFSLSLAQAKEIYQGARGILFT